MRTIIFIFFVYSANIFAQPYLFKKDYNVKSRTAFAQKSNIIKLPNNGYAVCFEDRSDSLITDTIKISILTFKSNGDVDWGIEIPMHISNSGAPISIFLAPDKTILLSYYFYSNTSDTINYNWFQDIIVCKIDLNGNILWTKIYGEEFENEYPRSIFGREDLIYICGDSYDTTGSVYSFLTQIDINGNVIFSKKYYLPPLPTTCLECKVTDNGAINNNNEILLTINNSINSSAYHYFLNVDSIGNVIWAKKMQTSGSYGSEIHSIKPLSDGSFLLCGREDFVSNGDWDIFIMKISKQGNLIFSKAFGGIWPDEAMWIEENYKNEIILLCEPESYLGGISQTAVYKLDSNANMIWGYVYNAPNASYPFGATKNNEDTTYTIFGVNGSYNDIEEIFLLKIDDDGNAPCNKQSVTFPILDFGLLQNISVNEFIAFGSLDTNFTVKPITVSSNLICDLGTYLIPTQPKEDSSCKLRYFIPNVFSPNRDNFNNKFKILIECYKSFSLTIYNRWGQKLFYSEFPENGWDGKTTSGEDVTEGTYYYLVKIDGVVKKGFLTLFR